MSQVRIRRIQAIRRQLAAVQGRAAVLLWDVGQVLNEVHRDQLWKEEGYRSYTAWLESLPSLSRRSATRCMQLAEHFSRDSAAAFGADKLLATLDYLDATAREEAPGDLLALRIPVRLEDGRFDSVSYPDASTAQIQAATRFVAERGAEDGPASDGTRELLARIEHLTQDLPEGPRGTWRGDRVQVKRGPDGAVGLTVHGVPPDRLDAVLAALKGVR